MGVTNTMRIYSNKPITWQRLLHIRAAIHMGVQMPPYDMFTLYKSRRVDALIEPIGKSCQSILYMPREFVAYNNCERVTAFDSPKTANYKAMNILGETIYVPHTFEHGDKIVIDDIDVLSIENKNDNIAYNNKIDNYLQAYLI